MTEKIRQRLVPGWQLWWRKWSTWLAAVAAGIAASMVAAPSLVLGFIAFIPEDWRGFAAGATFILVFVVPVLIANLRQKNLDARR